MLLPAVVSIALMALAQAATGCPLQRLRRHHAGGRRRSSWPRRRRTVVARDLRFRVAAALPVAARQPVDYVGAKVAAMTAALFLLVAVPLTLIYVGELLIDLPGAAADRGVPRRHGRALVLRAAAVHPRPGDLLAHAHGAASAWPPSSPSTCCPRRRSRSSTARWRCRATTPRPRWAWLVNPFWLVDAVQSGLFGTTSARRRRPIPGAGHPRRPGRGSSSPPPWRSWHCATGRRPRGERSSSRRSRAGTATSWRSTTSR